MTTTPRRRLRKGIRLACSRLYLSGVSSALRPLNANRAVVSESRQIAKPEAGIGRVVYHRAVLHAGTVSHDDVRWILRAAMQIDEVYDADYLDLCVAYLAAEAGLSVTLIGDPWQALYKWRGATPEVVERLLEGTSDQFIAYEQPESFRFRGEQMPQLAASLRVGSGAALPLTASTEIDVALARNWTQLWSVGDNILPLAFQTVNNATDAALNLLLDVVTRARLGTASYGREGAITKLGLDHEQFQAKQDEVFRPLVESLSAGKDEGQVLEDLRDAVKSLGVSKPNRLSGKKEDTARRHLSQLAARLKQKTVIPGLTVFQAKGREWERVGVVFSSKQVAELRSGLRALDEEHCIIYVAITRAKCFCGCLSGTSEFEGDSLQLDV